MKRLMRIHLFLSCLVAPAMIFFAVSGAWQAYRFQQTRKDGSYVVIAGNSDGIFKRLMHAIGRPDLAEEPSLRFLVAGSRMPPEIAGLRHPAVDVLGHVEDLQGFFERIRLFFIIALGETVLTTGSAFTSEPFAVERLIALAVAFTGTVNST